MKKRFIFVICALLCVLSVAVFAQEFDGYIVKFKDDTMQSLASTAYSEAWLSEEMSDSDVVDYFVDNVEQINGLNSEHMLVTVEDDETLNLLHELGIVESYEPDYFAELSAVDVTTNPYYSTNQKWVYDAINAQYAWDNNITGDGAVVAVIDSGVYNHDDLSDILLEGKNFSVPNPTASSELGVEEDYEESNTSDNRGHGTFVSGIIAAQNNSIATVGLAFDVKIIPLKVVNYDYLPISKIIEAIYYAVDYTDCDVINLSLGTTSYSTNFENAVNYALSKNIILIAAAGNNGGTAYDYPASFEGVVSVANAQKNGTGFIINSTSRANDMVDIAAPGTAVYSLLNNQTGVTSGNGTSYATPLVTAMAALAKSIDASITPEQFENLIKLSANDSYITASQDENYWGAGMLDVKRTLELLQGDDIAVERDGDSITVINSGTEDLEYCSLTLKETDVDGNLTAFKVVIFTLDAGETYDVSLAEHGFTSGAIVKLVYEYVPGDVDGNGKINLQDAMCILRKNAGYEVENIVDKALDADGNGKVNLQDAVAILRYNAGYATELH